MKTKPISFLKLLAKVCSYKHYGYASLVYVPRA